MNMDSVDVKQEPQYMVNNVSYSVGAVFKERDKTGGSLMDRIEHLIDSGEIAVGKK